MSNTLPKKLPRTCVKASSFWISDYSFYVQFKKLNIFIYYGQGQLLKGFEQAVLGHKVGEIVKVTLPAAEAYGEYDPTQVFSVAKAQVPESIPLEIGTKLQLSSEKGVMFVQITDITDE